MWNGLGVNKAEKEKEFVCLSYPSSEASLYESSRYIEDLKKVTLIKQISSTESIWNTYYHIPPPLSHSSQTMGTLQWIPQLLVQEGYHILLGDFFHRLEPSTTQA